MLFQTCTKLTFSLSDVFVDLVNARNRINGVGSLFFRNRILRFGENMPQSLERFLSNFNFVAKICPKVWKGFWATLSLWLFWSYELMNVTVPYCVCVAYSLDNSVNSLLWLTTPKLPGSRSSAVRKNNRRLPNRERNTIENSVICSVRGFLLFQAHLWKINGSWTS